MRHGDFGFPHYLILVWNGLNRRRLRPRKGVSKAAWGFPSLQWRPNFLILEPDCIRIRVKLRFLEDCCNHLWSCKKGQNSLIKVEFETMGQCVDFAVCITLEIFYRRRTTKCKKFSVSVVLISCDLFRHYSFSSKQVVGIYALLKDFCACHTKSFIWCRIIHSILLSYW